MKKEKILFIIESMGNGGAEKVLSTLLKHIDFSLYDVTLCPILSGGLYEYEVKQSVNYQPIIYTPKNSLFSRLKYTIKYNLIYNWLPLKLVYRLFIPKDHDVEIAFCEGFVTKLISFSNNKSKKIAWVHMDLKSNPWPQTIGVYKNIQEETESYNKFSDIICVSKSVENTFTEVYGLHDKVKTIYNPIDTNDILVKCTEIIHTSKENNLLTLITVGRLAEQKGYDILLKVVKRLKCEGFKFVLKILGDGPQRESLLQYIESHELDDCIQLMGFQPNPYPYIAQSDIFVCSSRSEGYSLVIAEALVLGKPIISTYCSGPNELLSEGEYGMLVANREDGEGLYNGLKNLLSNTSLLNKYKKKAAARGKEFSLESTMKQIESLFVIK